MATIIFTLPTTDLRLSDHFQQIQTRYDLNVQAVCRWMSHTPQNPYRIVLDIELPVDRPEFACPSVWLLDCVGGILLDVDTLSLDLFKEISLMVINSIREDGLDVVLETAIASTCAAIVFKELHI